MQYADIIIDISHEQLDRTFQYAVPPELQERIQVGSPVVIPFGKGNRAITGYVVNLTDEPNWDPAKIKPIARIPSEGVPIESHLIALAYWMKSHYGATMNQALRTVIPIKQKAAPKEKKVLHLLLEEQQLQDVYTDLISRKRHSIPKQRLLEALMEQPDIPWDVVTGKLGIASTVIRDFEKNAWIEIESVRDYRNPLGTIHAPKRVEVTLNEEQEIAVESFAADYDMGIRKPYLLYGVTGSGKTEVYMEMISHVLSQGRQAIVLIPEIALTYQTVMRFYQRFGKAVSILNSRMSPGERYDQFERAKKGDIQIMVGPRSALFTPFPDLGLIIIDEEHEPTYKSEQVPRYHARETAVYRAKLTDASVILGSATPSLESFYRMEQGEYGLLRLSKRVEERNLPECDIVDLRQELMEGNRSIISRRLQELLADRLERGEQSMLFLNRRGMMGFVSCRACGEVLKCPHCDVSLSMHRDGKLHCHYCGYTTPMVSKCPSCGSKYIGGFKAGTQKIEETVQKMFPKARILRMDADTTKGKNGHQDILNAFANEEADILLGTQMIVKGHDFPKVTLMGVLAADMSLNANDFRSAERTFDLLTQASGRAGRGELPGNVVIQTYQPEHYSILAAAKSDYDDFYKQEIVYRRMMAYPPCAHMLLVSVTSLSDAEAAGKSQEIADYIKEKYPKVFLAGPHDAGIKKVNDIYRRILYMKSDDYEELVAIKDAVEAYNRDNSRYRKASIWFDFDPMSGF